MPVLVFIREILRVDTDDLATLVAVVGEHALVALDAVRVVVPQDVPAGRERLKRGRGYLVFTTFWFTTERK